MTPQKAKVIFATHMQASRKRTLTTYEKNQLSTARQVLRQSKKPAMNPVEKRAKRFFSTEREANAYIRRLRKSDIIADPPKKSEHHSGLWTVDIPKQIGKGKRIARPNPSGVYMNYRVLRIEAIKTPGHICDAECKKHGHRYFHNFKTKPKMYGLADGSLLIKS